MSPSSDAPKEPNPPELVTAWRSWVKAGCVGVLEGDEALLTCVTKICDIRSWDQFLASEHWVGRSDRTHLGLLPIPYVGNLSEASIFILLLNPGFHPLDYFAEFRIPEYRTAVADCLVQNRAGMERGFYVLDPELCWTGGFRYWHAKLLGVMEAFAAQTGCTLQASFAFAQKSIAAVELLPYHSSNFGIPSGIVQNLRSVQLVQQFVKGSLTPLADHSKATLIVTRKAKQWGLTARDRVVIYGPSESRSAHLTPKSRGGGEILRALLERFQDG